MKSLLIASAALALASAAAPALAQDLGALGPVSGYGTLGYSNLDGDHDVDLSGIQGRLGARLGRYLGVEGDVTGGFDGDQTRIAGDPSSVRLRNQYAGYAVGFLPVAPNTEVFARIGYGRANFKANDYTTATTYNFGHDSVNYGVGAQYFFAGPNGIRADYTRYDYRNHGGDANVWSVAYVRKF